MKIPSLKKASAAFKDFFVFFVVAIAVLLVSVFDGIEQLPDDEDFSKWGK